MPTFLTIRGITTTTFAVKKTNIKQQNRFQEAVMMKAHASKQADMRTSMMTHCDLQKLVSSGKPKPLESCYMKNRIVRKNPTS